MKNVTIFQVLIFSISFLFGFQQKSEGILLQDANQKDKIENPDYQKENFEFKKGMKFVFNYMKSESVRPSKDLREFLDKLGKWMVIYPNGVLRVTGHSDQVGSDKEIQERSENRAKEIQKYLVAKFGLSLKRIITSGEGARKPIADVFSEAGKAQNRRVEIEVVGE